MSKCNGAGFFFHQIDWHVHKNSLSWSVSDMSRLVVSVHDSTKLRPFGGTLILGQPNECEWGDIALKDITKASKLLSFPFVPGISIYSIEKHVSPSFQF